MSRSNNNCYAAFRLTFSVLLLVALFIHPNKAEAAQATITFTPLPLVSEAVIHQQFGPFSTYLENITKTPVQLVYHNSYQTLIEDMAADKIDLAYLGPLPYVLLLRQGRDFQPVVRFRTQRGDTSYSCSLVHFENNLKLKNLTAQQPIALPQPYSTCAYLMTEHFLQQQGSSLENFNYYYAGNHAEAALDVIRGKAAFAGIKTSIAQEFRHLGLIIDEYPLSVPGFLLVANPRTLSSRLIDTIRTELLALDPKGNKADEELTQLWNNGIRYGAVPVKQSDYEFINELLLQIKIPGINR